MQEKRNHSQPMGICHRLITFLMNSLIARSLIKRVTLGHPIPQDLQPVIPAANPNGFETAYLHQAGQTPEHGSGFEIQVHFKQSNDDFESWTQIDELAPLKSHASELKGKSLPQIQERTDSQVPGKGPREMRPISTAASQTRDVPKNSLSIKDVAELEKEKSNKNKGKSLMGTEKLTLAIDPEDDERSKLGLRRVRPLFHVAPNINEKSDAFIRSRKEAMRRNYSLEPSIS